MPAIVAGPTGGRGIVVATTATGVVATALLVPALIGDQGGTVLLGLGGLAAFTGLVLAFVRAPHVACAATLAFLVVQPTLRTFASESFGPAKDVVVASAIVAALLTTMFGPAERRRTIDAWLVAGVATLIALYIVNPAGVHDTAWSNGARLAAEAYGLLLVGMSLPDRQRTWRWVSPTVVVLGCIVAVWGLMQQSIGYVSLVDDFGYTYGDQVRQTASGQFRSFGTLNDPFSYATFLLLALVVLILDWRPRRWMLPLAVLLVAGLVAAYVRTGLVLLPLVGAFALLQFDRAPSAAALVSACLLGGVLLLVVFPQADAERGGALGFITTANGRSDNVTRLFDDAARLPAGEGVGETGTGAARTAADAETTEDEPLAAQTDETFERFNLDSSYLATVYDVGLIGLAVLLACMLRIAHIARLSVRLVGSSAGRTALGIGLVMMLDALTRTSLTAFPAGFIGLFLIGLSIGAAQDDRLGPPRPR